MGARILVIEDNPANLELMSYLLTAFGHEVLTACDGEAGLEATRRESPDLIICDIQIPNTDGLSVARQLKRHPSLGKIPLVAVTAFAMVGDRDKALSAGFDGYIPKPIVPDKFVKQVEAFLPAFEQVAPELPAAAAAAGPCRQDKCETILVVDDSEINTELARSILEPVGYTVVVARGVAQALELVGEIRPDLILSDVHMRFADGFDFLKTLKSDHVFRDMPFVFISSTIWEETDRKKAIALGAAEFIVRPADPEVVLLAIERCLAERRSANNGDDPGNR
jgi:two-component system cell cycle response regulator